MYINHISNIIGLVSSTTKTGRHDIDEILLKVALNTQNQSINLMLISIFIQVWTMLGILKCWVFWRGFSEILFPSTKYTMLIYILCLRLTFVHYLFYTARGIYLVVQLKCDIFSTLSNVTCALRYEDLLGSDSVILMFHLAVDI